MDPIIHDKSMSPFLKPGDRLALEFFAKPTPISDFCPGQILLLRDSHEWIAHRVLDIGDLRTSKGDRSSSIDDSNAMAWALVTGRWRKGRKAHWGNRPHRLHGLFEYLSRQRTPESSIVKRAVLSFLLSTAKAVFDALEVFVWLKGRL